MIGGVETAQLTVILKLRAKPMHLAQSMQGASKFNDVCLAQYRRWILTNQFKVGIL